MSQEHNARAKIAELAAQGAAANWDPARATGGQREAMARVDALAGEGTLRRGDIALLLGCGALKLASEDARTFGVEKRW